MDIQFAKKKNFRENENKTQSSLVKNQLTVY